MTFARYYNPICVATIVGQIVTFADGEGLQMRITIERSLEAVPDRCDISIAGLDPERARLMGAAFRLTDVGQVVNVAVGYDAVPINAFNGTLESFSDNQWIGRDMWTHATAGDGADLWDTSKVLQLPGTLNMTLLNLATSAAGLGGVTISPEALALINSKPDVPFTFSGARTIPALFDVVARRLRARWYTRDRVLYLVQSGIPNGQVGTAVLLAPYQPGPRLPGVPLIEPISYGGGGLLQGVSFVEPRIVPGGQVVHEGGLFRIEHVVHSIDTRGSAPWSSRFVGRAL